MRSPISPPPAMNSGASRRACILEEISSMESPQYAMDQYPGAIGSLLSVGSYITLAPMELSRRNVFLLACCQALLLTNAVTLITIGALAGYILAQNKALATLPAATYVV